MRHAHKYKFIFNESNNTPVFSKTRYLDYGYYESKVICLDSILSQEINELGYITVTGLYFDENTNALFEITIHNVTEAGEILRRLDSDTLAESKLLYKYELAEQEE